MLELQEFLDLVFRLTGVFSSDCEGEVADRNFSEVWAKLFLQRTGGKLPQRRGSERTQLLDDNLLVPPPSQDSRRYGFPDIPGLLGLKFNEPHPQTRQTISGPALKAIFSSWSTIGPFVPRLVSQGELPQPMITVTLQRTTMDVGGNLGMLSIGELPTGVKASDLTWVPLRNYSAASGGIPAPSDSPNEVRAFRPSCVSVLNFLRHVVISLELGSNDR